MTNITLHGDIAEQVGRENWKIKVNSIKEALRAIQVLSKGKLLKYLIGAAEKSVEYKVIVNKREIMNPENISLEKPESILNSELVMINEKLETLDIVPIIKGAGGGGGEVSAGGSAGTGNEISTASADVAEAQRMESAADQGSSIDASSTNNSSGSMGGSPQKMADVYDTEFANLYSMA